MVLVYTCANADHENQGILLLPPYVTLVSESMLVAARIQNPVRVFGESQSRARMGSTDVVFWVRAIRNQKSYYYCCYYYYYYYY